MHSPHIRPEKPAGPLKPALIAQLAGLFAAGILALAKPGLWQQPLFLALIQSLFAAWIARLNGAPLWWQGIHAVFLPAALMLNELHLPPLIWLAGFALLFLVYWRTDSSQAPLYLSNRATGCALADLIPSEPGFVIDLGCGTGGLLAQLSSIRPDCQFIGIEHAPIPFLIAKWRCRKLANVHIRRDDLWATNLGACQLVYAFLSPVPMARLWHKARNEMLPDALLVSNSFDIPGATPERVIPVADRRQTRLLCYRPGHTAPSNE